jgi:hypothetical protein
MVASKMKHKSEPERVGLQAGSWKFRRWICRRNERERDVDCSEDLRLALSSFAILIGGNLAACDYTLPGRRQTLIHSKRSALQDVGNSARGTSRSVS